MITTRMMATVVYSMSALAVAITWRAAMNVRPGANRSRPTANALAGAGSAIILDTSPCFLSGSGGFGFRRASTAPAASSRMPRPRRRP